jgi:hypothetical protein
MSGNEQINGNKANKDKLKHKLDRTYNFESIKPSERDKASQVFLPQNKIKCVFIFSYGLREAGPLPVYLETLKKWSQNELKSLKTGYLLAFERGSILAFQRYRSSRP